MKTLFLGAAALVLLSACANNQQADRAASGKQAASSPVSVSYGACRPAGTGHTINRHAKNDIYMCSVSAAMNSAKAKEVLDPAVRIRYGSAGSNPLTSRQISNAVGKSPEETCQQAFLSTLIQFQKAAKKRNARNASVVSYYDKKTVGGGVYECHIATFNSKVVLRGSVY